MRDPTCKAKLLKITTQAVERVEQLKQKNAASAPDLEKLLDQLPPPPSTEPCGGLSKSSARGGSNTMRKFMGKLKMPVELVLMHIYMYTCTCTCIYMYNVYMYVHVHVQNSHYPGIAGYTCMYIVPELQ